MAGTRWLGGAAGPLFGFDIHAVIGIKRGQVAYFHVEAAVLQGFDDGLAGNGLGKMRMGENDERHGGFSPDENPMAKPPERASQ